MGGLSLQWPSNQLDQTQRRLTLTQREGGVARTVALCFDVREGEVVQGAQKDARAPYARQIVLITTTSVPLGSAQSFRLASCALMIERFTYA